MTFDEALEILAKQYGGIGGDGSGIYVQFLPEPPATEPSSTEPPAPELPAPKLPITVLTDIEIALVASTSTESSVEERAEGLRAVGRFLASSTVSDASIGYPRTQVPILVKALEDLKGCVDG